MWFAGCVLPHQLISVAWKCHLCNKGDRREAKLRKIIHRLSSSHRLALITSRGFWGRIKGTTGELVDEKPQRGAEFPQVFSLSSISGRWMLQRFKTFKFITRFFFYSKKIQSPGYRHFMNFSFLVGTKHHPALAMFWAPSVTSKPAFS